MMKLFKIICSLLIASTMHPHNTCGGFQLSMVASTRQRNNNHQLSTRTSIERNIPFSSANTSISKPKNNKNVPSTLISNLACMALKRRLSDHSHVSCDLSSIDPNTILFGRVGPVTVKGRSWKSPLGLTCRAIEATVTECQLDMGKVISKQKLVLNTPALGSAMVALSDTDFGNFITHPLMKPPSPPQLTNESSINGNNSADNNKLLFLRENVSLNPSSGIVTFYGTYAGSKWKFMLQRNTTNNNGDKASIHASLVKEEEGSIIQDVDAIEKALTKTTSKFFNEMDFELDGTFLSFDDMMLTEKGSEPSVMISLRIKVIKFPSPGLEF